MRNLKKILALVLALMMVLSVMVTASAADYADADAIEHKEAVEVLTAAGVIRGVGNDNFDPDGILNRAQAATIIAYILEGSLDNISNLVDAVENPFTDVPAWAEPYVLYAYSNGVVVGTSATTYSATKNLTGYEFGKMLLITIGLCESADFTPDGWKLTVATELKDNLLLTGLSDIKLSAPLSREHACQMAFNAMTYTANGTVKGYTVTGIPNTVFATYIEAYIMADKDTTKVQPYTDNSGSILTDKFEIVPGTLSTDVLGRPEATKWVNAKGDVVYVDYETPLLTVEGATYVPAVATPSKYWNFDSATYLYNGQTEANWNGADLTKGGVTTQLYGVYDKTTGVYTVTKAVSTEYYFATIKDVNATTKAITLSVEEAGYVISNSSAKDITVAYDSTKAADKQSANYLALAGYAKGTALAVLVAPNWENTLTILDVKEPTTVSGTVTSAAIATNYEGYVVVGGSKYTFANEYSQASVDVGADGTFYLLNGLVIGFMGTPAPDAVTDTVYVVDHYATYVPETKPVTDAYGTVIKEGSSAYYLISAQCVDMEGNIVLYPVATADKAEASETDTYTAYEQDIKLFTATASGLYTVSAATNVAPITVEQNKISYSNAGVNYYYNAAEYVSILGSKSTLSVSTGSNAAAIGSTNAWAVYGQTTSANKTVSKIFYWNATAGEPVPENVFVYFGVNTVPEKSVITLADGKTKVNVYTYNVFEGGVAKTIKSYNSTLGADYYEYYVDEYGICVVSELDGVYAAVENIYGSYITVAGLADVYDNFDITGIPVVDLTTADANNPYAANGAIEAGEYVVFYAVVQGSYVYIDCIYIVDAPAV